MKKIFLSFLIMPFLIMPFFVSAQEVENELVESEQDIEMFTEDNTIVVGDSDKTVEEIGRSLQEDGSFSSVPEGQVDCFDYYTFQSVSVSVAADEVVNQPGTDVHFSGEVINENDYPIVDGVVFVRIGKKNESFEEEGHYIADEFVAVENVIVPAQSEKKVEFTWTVPEMGNAGEYVVDYFFSVGKKFNLGGLPFSNEVVAGTTDIEISSTVTDFVSFEKNNTTFNGEKYYHIGSWPEVLNGESVEIKNVLRNSFDDKKQVNVTHELYRWDSLDGKDLLDTKTEYLMIEGNSSQEIVYELDQASEAVYYLKTTATYDNDNKSIINVRFSTDVPRARLNFPGITKFPIEKGDDVTLFTCFHNMTYGEFEGSVDVQLTDREGDRIGGLQYSDPILSGMMAVKEDVVAEKEYDYVHVSAKIKDAAGNIIDEYETEYDCAKIGNCDAQWSVFSSDGGVMSTKNIIAFIVFALVSIVVIIVLFKMMKKNSAVSAFLLGGIITFGLVLGSSVDAKSVTASKNYHLTLRSIYSYDTLSRGTVGVTHNLNVASGSTNMGCGGSVRFRYSPSLTFNGSGGTFDTPYGKLCSNYTSSSCFGGRLPKVQRVSGSRSGIHGYVYFTGRTPRVTSLTSSDNSVLRCSGLTCTSVPGSTGGTVTVTANFSNTPVRVWQIINARKDRTNIRCSGSILGQSRCTGSYAWYSPTEENKVCGGGGCISARVNFKTTTVPAPRPMQWTVTVASCRVDGQCDSTAQSNDYSYTATGPSTPLCANGNPADMSGNPLGVNETVPFPAGQYGAASEVAWTCNGVGGGSNATCSAQRTPPPNCECSSTMNGQTLSYLQTTWPAAFCEEGAVIGATPAFPGTGGSASWQCGGSTCSNGPVDCSVNRGTPDPCACGPADQTQSTTAPSTGLCNAGNASSVTGNDVWNWTCGTDYNDADLPPGANNGQCIDQTSCEAECIDVSLDAPGYVYMEDGETKTVEARIQINGNSSYASDIDCTIEGQSVTFPSGSNQSDPVEISIAGSTTIHSQCTIDVDCGNNGNSSTRTYTGGDMDQIIQAACMQRSCSAQGRCQAVPRDAATGCTSTCNSDADCSTGRMIETRP